MPKYIKNLDSKILECAEKEFISNSYDNVSMRQIAKQLDIAVGTLYNYYSNKAELFLNVFKYSWNKTFSILEAITLSDDAPCDKLKSFIDSIYDELCRRNGLGRQIYKIQEYFIKKDCFNEKEIQQKFNYLVQDKLIDKLNILLIEIEKQYNLNIDKNERNRLVLSIISSIFTLSKEYYKDKVNNTTFLVNLVNAFYLNKVNNPTSANAYR